MKLALTGASGFLGSSFIENVLNSGGAVLSFARRAHPLFTGRARFEEVVKGSLSDERRELVSFKPDLFVHCAAMSTPVACEKDPQIAWGSNCDLVQHYCLLSQEQNLFFVGISTDLVFDGALAPKGGFSEKDLRAPLSVYAKSKAAGEDIVLAYSNAAILRTSLLLGKPQGDVTGPLGWMVDAAIKGIPLELFKDEWRTAILVEDVIKAVLAVGDKKLSGLFHLGGGERLSRVELGEKLLCALGKPSSLIKSLYRKEKSAVPPRPEDVSLNSDKLWGALRLRPKAIFEGFQELFST